MTAAKRKALLTVTTRALNKIWDKSGPELTLEALADLLKSKEMPHLGQLIRRLAKQHAKERSGD